MVPEYSKFVEAMKLYLISFSDIMKTSPYNVYLLTPHFYIVKLEFTGVNIFLVCAIKHRSCIQDLCFFSRNKKKNHNVSSRNYYF